MNQSASPPPHRDKAGVLAGLRNAIGSIEATSADLVRAPRPVAQADDAPRSRPKTPRSNEPITYPGMPEGPNWMEHLPARYQDGQRGFDRRIMEELAAVGVPCYTLDDLSNRVRTIPQGIPIFIDWLTHLEERIPGAETPHRESIRAGLIRNLNDLAARGNPAAIDVLVAQLRRQPPMRSGLVGYATEALARITTKRNFTLIAELIDELEPQAATAPLIEYLGKVKTDEARDLALKFLDTPFTSSSIRALIQMKARGVRDRVEPYVHDSHSWIRKEARRAMERLPE